MRIILIRHGQTDLNAQKKYVGWTDCRLNAEGKQQAKKVGRRLLETSVRKIYTSDLKRSKEFAKIAFKNIPMEHSRQLREINFGIFEGLTHKQITDKYPRIYSRWLADPSRVAIPKGESLCFLRKRVKMFLKEKIKEEGNGTIVLVTHAGPIKVLLEDFLESKSFWDATVNNAAISVIEKKNGRGRLTIFNDTSFLE